MEVDSRGSLVNQALRETLVNFYGGNWNLGLHNFLELRNEFRRRNFE